MPDHDTTRLAVALRDLAYPLTGTPGDYDPLLERIGPAPIVLIGEASHGTHEFYEQRAAITKRLIAEKCFTAVAVEADWPDAYEINRYVRGFGDGATSVDGLDLYSLYSSVDAVLRYLEKVDPEAAQRARHRYACFEHFGEDSQSYGYAASFGQFDAVIHLDETRALEPLEREAGWIAGEVPETYPSAL